MQRLSWSCVLVFAMACGGGASSSGVDGSKKLTMLSASEQSDLCAYILDVLDAPRTVDCGHGVSVMIEADGQCDFSAFDASCQATVDDSERCVEAVDADPCKLDVTACDAVLQCRVDAIVDRAARAR
jgi:hypothetical protein